MSKLIFRKRNKYFGLLFLALLVSIFSFPEIEFEYNIGIDPPLTWLYNHLFSNGFYLGRNIIFPHGPLAFFMYPLANNFILSVIVTIFFQLVFIFQLFYLLNEDKWQYWVLTAILAWFIFSISNFNQLIASNISVAYLLYLKHEKPLPKYWGLLLTAFAVYVKAYIAIIAGTLTFSLLAIEFIRTKNYKRSLIDISLVLLAMLLFWLIIYGNPAGFVNYGIGMFHLAGDNSAAAAFHPDNNWLYILPFLIVLAAIPFLQRTKEGKTAGLLFLPAFFAAWKYGMAREDFFHVRTFLFFTAISMILFLVYNRKNLLINLPAVVMAFILFGANMKNVENSQPLSINYSGIVNFTRFISSYTEVKAESEQQNRQNISVNLLPDSIRNQIGNSTVDIYPYDYTIVAANQLNWKARPVIQSYAAYTSWLDKKNADHFKSSNAPEYFIFGLNNITSDLNGGKLESIDNRYLLNDEPQTLIELIKKYECIYSDENFLVYRRSNQPLEIRSAITNTQLAKWNQWIAIPDSASHFTRLKLHTDRSFLGNIKSFLYKDELYYMYFKTLNGNTLKYRIVPQNAADGIWISPFHTSAGNNSPSEKITEILVTVSDKDMVKNTFSYEFEYFDTDEKTMDSFFGKDSTINPEVIINESFNLESDQSGWNSFDAKNVIYNPIDHQKYYRVNPDGFSPSFSCITDSLPMMPTRITIDCWLRTKFNGTSSLVIETENAAGEKNWHGIEINRQIINIDEINHVFNYIDLNLPVSKVTVYVWNNGKEPVMISSLNVKLITNQQYRTANVSTHRIQ